MSLRPYQREGLNAITGAVTGNDRHLLIVWPTSAGKTVLFSHLPEALGMKPGEKLLTLVHRNELVFQAQAKLQQYNPNLHVGIEKAQYRADESADIVVASVQTIGSSKLNEDGSWTWCERLKKFDRDEFRYIVIDEAHHALGESYRSVMRYFRCYKPEPAYDDARKLLIGVTATPERSDSMGLEVLFDRIAHSKELREMVEEGWICHPHGHIIHTSVDISGVRTTKGDFAIGELEKATNTPARNNLIVKKYQELGEGMRAVAFTVDVQHSVDLAKAFNDAGIRAFALSGNTPELARKQMLQLYRDGYYRVAVSCGVLLEGWDDPGACVALMARPTKSGLLYRQAVGRVLRPHPAPEELAALRAAGKPIPWIKPYAIILDFVDISGRHALNTVPTLLGLKPEFDLKGKSAVKAVQEMEKVIGDKKLSIAISDVGSVEELKGIAERIDLFAKPTISDVARQNSQFAWVNSGTGYQLSLPDYVTLRISQNTLGQWEVSRSVKGVRSPVAATSDLRRAFNEADKLVPAESRGAIMAEAQWRNNEPSEKQLKLLWSFGINRNGMPNFETYSAAMKKKYTKGDCSTMISSSPRLQQYAGRR